MSGPPSASRCVCVSVGSAELDDRAVNVRSWCVYQEQGEGQEQEEAVPDVLVSVAGQVRSVDRGIFGEI